MWLAEYIEIFPLRHRTQKSGLLSQIRLNEVYKVTEACKDRSINCLPKTCIILHEVTANICFVPCPYIAAVLSDLFNRKIMVVC